MKFEEIESVIASRCQSATFPAEPPSLADWQALEVHFGCRLPGDLYDLRVLSSRYHLEGDHLLIDEIIRDYEWELQHDPDW
jgi:hypothetical protein